MESKLLSIFTASCALAATTTISQASVTALFEDTTDTPFLFLDATFGVAPAAPAAVVTGGPSGNFLQLQPDGVDEQLSNAIFFNPSGDNTSTLRAEFDFRMSPDNGGSSAEGFGFSIYDVAGYGATGLLPLDFVTVDNNLEAVTYEQPRFPLAFSVGFDTFDGALETQKNQLTLNADGRRVADNILGFDINDGLFHRIVLDLANNGEDGVASLTFIRDVFGDAENISVFADEDVLGYQIPGSNLAASDPTGWAVAFGGRSGGGDNTVGVDLDNISVTAVPEPSVPLLISTLGVALLLRRRRA